MPNKKQKPTKSQTIKKNSAKLFKKLKSSERPSFVGFNDDDRSEYITGAHKRKLQRRAEGQKILEEKIKKEKKKERAMIKEDIAQRIAHVKKEKERLQQLEELSDKDFILSVGGFDEGENPFDDGPRLSQREQKKLFLQKQKEIRYEKTGVDVVVKTEYLDKEESESSEDEVKEESKNPLIKTEFDAFPTVDTPEEFKHILEQSNQVKKKKKKNQNDSDRDQPTGLDLKFQRENILKWEKIGRQYGLKQKNQKKKGTKTRQSHSKDSKRKKLK